MDSSLAIALIGGGATIIAGAIGAAAMVAVAIINAGARIGPPSATAVHDSPEPAPVAVKQPIPTQRFSAVQRILVGVLYLVAAYFIYVGAIAFFVLLLGGGKYAPSTTGMMGLGFLAIGALFVYIGRWAQRRLGLIKAPISN
jgi:hypothetical protein